MLASHGRAKGGLRVPFGFTIVLLLVLPSRIGSHHVSDLIARQPIAERPQKAALVSAFGAVHEQRFSAAGPMGASMPLSSGYTLAAFDPKGSELGAAILGHAHVDPANRQYGESMVNRSRKGDFAVSRKGDRLVVAKGESPSQPKVARSGSAVPPVAPSRAAPAEVADESARPAPDIRGYSPASGGEYRVARVSPENSNTAYPVLASPRPDAGSAPVSESGDRPSRRAAIDTDPALRASRLFFGVDPMGERVAALEPWAPGEAPQFEDFKSVAHMDVTVAGDPLSRPASAPTESTFKLASLPPDRFEQDWEGIPDAPVERAELPPILLDPAAREDAGRGGETVAPKGEVTGEDKRPMSPAERLKLDEKGRAKAEKCLAEAVYFEARGEAALGQVAVAQVVLNRAFSGKYPGTVCGVVYQNSHRHLACQFTFACDGIRDVIREPDMWERARKIAAEMLDGKLWLPEVGKATHYHATYVHPGWVREMKKMHRLGVHIFYRPRAWGDGGDAPEWSDPDTTQSVAKTL
jgi:spore germination cell wall hydrolase CwlJ-like protein